MIRVQKIAHASYSTTDLDVMTEYYTGILGLSIAAREKDAVFFGSTVDHHSVVLRKGDDARCTRIGFQISPDDDLAAFAKQVESQGIGTSLKKDPEPAISEMVTFADPKGTIMEVFKPANFSRQQFQNSGIVPLKLGHVAFHVTDVKLTTKFYCDVLGFRESDWMADVFSFLRCGPDHHAINLVRQASAATITPHLNCATGLIFRARAITSAGTASNCSGDPAVTASAITSSPTIAHRTVSLPNYSRNSTGWTRTLATSNRGPGIGTVRRRPKSGPSIP